MNVEKPVVLVLGMPGAGKTTIGACLGQALGLPFLSIGDLLRAARDADAIPRCHDPAAELLSRELRRSPMTFAMGCVLDFSPVTADGGCRLSETLCTLRFAVRHVVYVRVWPIEAEERCVRRGKRSGDPADDMRRFFLDRVVKEFRPYTLPMVRDAYRSGKLLAFDNRGDAVRRAREVSRVTQAIRVRWDAHA